MIKLDINFDNIHLIIPSIQYIDSFRDAIEEYRNKKVEDFNYPLVRTKREARLYFTRVENTRRGINMLKGAVPSSCFWLTDGKHYLGEGHIRHFLNDSLRRFGGNIGYSIRPSAWQQGLGSIQLSLLLTEARKLDIFNPVITCFDTNIASAKIIEKNGGKLISKVTNNVKGETRLTRIYNINLTILD